MRVVASPVLRAQPDEQLAKLAQAGNAAAFEAIVQRYRRPLLAYCRRLVTDDRAEDAVQQTFFAAYRALPGAGDVHLRAWLYRIAHNTAVDVLRGPQWGHAPLDPRIDGVERPDQVVLRRERFGEVLAAVRTLPPRQRDAIVLRELEGRSHDEIAAALGLSRGAARQLIARARSAVRKAAAAVIPVWLPERLYGAPGGSAPRIAEIAARGAFAAGATKAGVAALATSAIAVGGISFPGQPRGDEREALAAPPIPAEVRSPHRTSGTPRSDPRTAAVDVDKAERTGDGGSLGGGGSGPRSSGRVPDRDEGEERAGPNTAADDDGPGPIQGADPPAERDDEPESPEQREEDKLAQGEPTPADSEALVEGPQPRLNAASERDSDESS